jgi:hypothetical protein
VHAPSLCYRYGNHGTQRTDRSMHDVRNSRGHQACHCEERCDEGNPVTNIDVRHEIATSRLPLLAMTMLHNETQRTDRSVRNSPQAFIVERCFASRSYQSSQLRSRVKRADEFDWWRALCNSCVHCIDALF